MANANCDKVHVTARKPFYLKKHPQIFFQILLEIPPFCQRVTLIVHSTMDLKFSDLFADFCVNPTD